MKREKEEFIYMHENLKKNLEMCTILFCGKIISIDLRHEYKFKGKKEVFEMFFCCDTDNKLCKEKHLINSKIKKEYICDTAISPTMDEVYKYLHNQKIR